jgi:hypothetical protein
MRGDPLDYDDFNEMASEMAIEQMMSDAGYPGTEMEQDLTRYCQQYEDDLLLIVDSVVRPDGAGGQEIATLSVTAHDGVQEWHRPPIVHGDIDAWRAWVEKEFAPSFY